LARTNLLCTFAHRKDLNLIVDYVKQSYTIVERKIFVFNDAEKPNDLYVTYNVDPSEDYKKIPNTILIHRKKDTNSLYTVNALNEIIKIVNNGVLDKSYVVDWNNYKNSLLLTNQDGYRRIVLELYKRFDV
tara:strand:- start:658 stop:1050 length:393 start_codon:yes stop_codon:yes gene_type:complete